MKNKQRWSEEKDGSGRKEKVKEGMYESVGMEERKRKREVGRI